MVGMSELGFVQAMASLCASYKSLIWLQTSVEAFLTNAIDGIKQQLQPWKLAKVYGFYIRSTITHILGIIVH